MRSAAQVALFGVLSSHFVTAFSPAFTTPRQCETLRITWSSLDLPVVDMPMGEIFMSLIPLDDDPSRIAPPPYMLSVPPGGHDIAALPFPAGTQFFASAHFPGSTGLERRVVSKVFTVEHSANSDCLPTQVHDMDGRAKAKSFGKRQVGSSAPPAISVVGVNTIPAGGSSASATSSSPAPGATGTDGAVPLVSVIGTSEQSATGLPAPVNVAPAPSASGSAPPFQVVGTSYVSATNAAQPQVNSSGSSDGVYPTASYTDSSLVDATGTTTSYMGTATEMPEGPMVTEWVTVTVTQNRDNSMVEAPCNSSGYPSMPGPMMPPETITVAPYPAPTQTTVNTEVVHYTAFSDMVDAANSMFKAWNPYKPAYTPSTGN